MWNRAYVIGYDFSAGNIMYDVVCLATSRQIISRCAATSSHVHCRAHVNTGVVANNGASVALVLQSPGHQELHRGQRKWL